MYIPKNDFENNLSMNQNINNMPMNDKMFLEKSMESIIKSNIHLGQKNNNNKLLYNQRSPNYNFNYNYNYNKGINSQNYIDNIINMNNMNNINNNNNIYIEIILKIL